MPSALTAVYIPLLLKNAGLDDRLTGFLMSVPFILTLLFQTFWGRLADRSKYKNKALLTGILLCSVIIPLTGLYKSFWWLLLIISLYNFFYLPVDPVSDAISVEIGINYGIKYGSIRACGTIGFMLISFLSGYIVILGINAIFITAALIHLLTFFILLFIDKVEGKNHKKDKFNLFSFIFHTPQLLSLYFIAVFVNIAVSVQGAFYSIYFIENLKYSPEMLGVQAMLRPILEIPYLLSADRITKKFSAKSVLFLTVIMTGLRMLILGFSDNLIIIFIACFLFGFTYIVIHFYMVTIAAKLVPPEGRASVQSFTSTVSYVPRIVGSAGGGLLVAALGYGKVSVYAGILMLLVAVIFLFLPLKYKA
jgi:PPP family 3-phenylpropionic acid transporter